QPRVARRELLSDNRPIPRAEAAEPPSDDTERIDDHARSHALERDAKQIDHTSAGMLEHQLVWAVFDGYHLAPRMRWLDRRRLRRELLPRSVVDAIAQRAVIRCGEVKHFELRRAGAGGAIAAGLAPQLRALALARNAQPSDAERLAVAAMTPDRHLPRAA